MLQKYYTVRSSALTENTLTIIKFKRDLLLRSMVTAKVVQSIQRSVWDDRSTHSFLISIPMNINKDQHLWVDESSCRGERYIYIYIFNELYIAKYWFIGSKHNQFQVLLNPLKCFLLILLKVSFSLSHLRTSQSETIIWLRIQYLSYKKKSEL